MSLRTDTRRWTVRVGAASVTAAVLTIGLAGVAGAQVIGQTARTPATGYAASAGRSSAAGHAPRTRSGSGSADPYSPATGHPYRRGVLPTTRQLRLMRDWARRTAGRSARPAASKLNLTYGGGFNGPAVTTGHEKVYLVFWGSQWGRARTGSHRNVTLAGDPSGEAPDLQQLFKGLGAGGETWSGVMTQYCGGIAYDTAVCPASSSHVGYPTGGALAGVWVDERVASPAQSSGNQLGAEAIAAARHFGNATAASNRNAQYVILSPTGANPDGFNTPNGQFCAWHDDTADPDLPGGPVNSRLDVAFTNMPYVTDAGLNCGQDFVNSGSAGLVDGVSIVEGHEYAETITDQFPAAGWTDTAGAEAGDLCAWNPVGGIGGTNDLRLPTGTFAMQSIWSNDSAGGGCRFSHPIVRDK
jgi:hypothetical protein